MKKLFPVLVIIFFNLSLAQAQNSIPYPNKLNRAWVTLRGEKGTQKGVLFETRDSSVILSDSYEKSDYPDGNYTLQKLDVSKINTIAVRNKKSIGRGALIGGLTGAGLGAVIGLTSKNNVDEPNASAGVTAMTTVATTVFIGAIGTGIGAAFGIIRAHIHIHGNQEQFEEKRDRLNSRSLTYDPAMNGSRISSFKRLPDTVVDIDGNVYHTVALGSMVFLAENLKVKHFRNGKEIPEIKDSTVWRTCTSSACCNYMNDPVFARQCGKLYNGRAIADTSGVCPDGWHIPSADEWTSLVMCQGGHANAGGYLKEEGTSHWSSPNRTMLTGSTFALPGGNRNRKGAFSQRGRTCQWWASKVAEAEDYQGLSLSNENTAVTIIAPDQNSGLSVRCMRNQ